METKKENMNEMMGKDSEPVDANLGLGNGGIIPEKSETQGKSRRSHGFEMSEAHRRASDECIQAAKWMREHPYSREQKIAQIEKVKSKIRSKYQG